MKKWSRHGSYNRIEELPSASFLDLDRREETVKGCLIGSSNENHDISTAICGLGQLTSYPSDGINQQAQRCHFLSC